MHSNVFDVLIKISEGLLTLEPILGSLLSAKCHHHAPSLPVASSLEPSLSYYMLIESCCFHYLALLFIQPLIVLYLI